MEAQSEMNIQYSIFNSIAIQIRAAHTCGDRREACLSFVHGRRSHYDCQAGSSERNEHRRRTTNLLKVARTALTYYGTCWYSIPHPRLEPEYIRATRRWHKAK